MGKFQSSSSFFTDDLDLQINPEALDMHFNHLPTDDKQGRTFNAQSLSNSLDFGTDQPPSSCLLHASNHQKEWGAASGL